MTVIFLGSVIASSCHVCHLIHVLKTLNSKYRQRLLKGVQRQQEDIRGILYDQYLREIPSFYTKCHIILRPFITYACGFQQSNSTEKKNTRQKKNLLTARFFLSVEQFLLQLTTLMISRVIMFLSHPASIRTASTRHIIIVCFTNTIWS